METGNSFFSSQAMGQVDFSCKVWDKKTLCVFVQKANVCLLFKCKNEKEKILILSAHPWRAHFLPSESSVT